MITIAASQKVDELLTNYGFNKNGEDYFRNYAVTDLNNEWEEEMYVSHTGKSYEVFFPERESKNRSFKSERGILNYLEREYWHFKDTAL